MTLKQLFATAALAFVTFAAHAHGFQLGAIKIGHPYARATAPGQPTGGAFMSFDNAGPDDRLLSVSAPVADAAQLHSMSMEGNVMRMRQVDAIELKAGRSVALAPGGLHVMLVGLHGPLKEGTNFPLKLTFEKAGEVTVQVNVEGPGASHAGHDMGEMKK